MSDLSPLACRVTLCAVLLLCGCASDGFFARHESPRVGDDCVGPQFVQFERGQPNVVVDSVGWVFGIPNRILLWNWDVQNHDISIETEQQLRQYVAANGLQDVKVRLNQYDPGGEWQRLAQNTRVGAGWRYTVGALGTLGYTVFPGRLFAIDYYNPFTNTVNVYSDVPALGMREVAYAGDVIERDLPGTYAFSQLIPGVSLVHETITTRDVLDYVETSSDLALREETVHVLYPSYGGSVGGAIDYYVPAAGSLFQLGGVLVGHVSGRWETRGWNRGWRTLPGPPLSDSEELSVTPPEQISVSEARPINGSSEPVTTENPVVNVVHEEPAADEPATNRPAAAKPTADEAAVDIAVAGEPK